MFQLLPVLSYRSIVDMTTKLLKNSAKIEFLRYKQCNCQYTALSKYMHHMLTIFYNIKTEQDFNRFKILNVTIHSDANS